MYAVLHMNYKPSEFSSLPQKEKAFVIACINEKVAAANRNAREAKAKLNKSGKGRK